MPLNMNTVGTGTGIGGSGSTTTDLVYSSDNIDMQYITNGITYGINNDFMYYPNISSSDDYMRKYRTICGGIADNVSNSSSYKYKLGDAFWIKSIPYCWVYRVFSGNGEVDPQSYESLTIGPGLYMINVDGTYTEISLPRTAACTLKNPSLCLDDGIIIVYGSNYTSSSYDENGGIDIYGLCVSKFTGSTFTTIMTGEKIAKYLGWTYSSSSYAFIWNAFVNGNKLYLVVDGSTSFHYKIISIDLETLNIITECEDAYAYPYDHAALLSGLSIVLGNTMYTVKPTKNGNGDWWNQVLYYEKYNMSMTKSSLTLTTVTSDLLESSKCSGDDFGIGGGYNYFMKIQSRLEKNHYLIGMGLINSAENEKESGSGTLSDYAEPLYIHTNTLEVYLDDNSNIVERKVFTTPTRYSRWQKIAYIGNAGGAREPMHYQCALSFYIDPFSSMLGIIAGPTGSNSSNVNVFRRRAISDIISQKFDASNKQIITGYLYKGDRIYTSGIIKSITCNGSTTNINKNKYTITTSGVVSIDVYSSNKSFPITIITDTYGSLVYFKTEKISVSGSDDQILWSLIAGMKVNDEKISTNVFNQPIDFNKYKHRIYIDMKGV